jgi:hypothetical protein
MAVDLLFAIRGLLSFVAFTEFTTALRCLMPYTVAEESDQSYVQARLFSEVKLGLEAERTLCHTYGLLSALVGLVVVHAAVFSHYYPLVTLAVCALSLKVLFILAETFIFGSIAAGQHLIFPLVAGLVSIVVSIALLFVTGDCSFYSDENAELVKRVRRMPKAKKM